MPELTKYEEIILIAILQLEENAYGVHINRQIHETTGKQWNYGTMYRMLDQLARKRLVDRMDGQPIKEKGGRSKTYYSITQEGILSLRESYTLQQSLWDKKIRLALDKGRS